MFCTAEFEKASPQSLVKIPHTGSRYRYFIYLYLSICVLYSNYSLKIGHITKACAY